MLTRLAQWWLGKSQLTNKDDWFYQHLLGGSRSSAGVVINATRALQEVVTMACVTIRAQDLAKLPVHVYRARKDGGQDIIKNHPLEALLRKPNPWQTRFEFLETVGMNYLLRGNGHAVVPQDARGRPTSMIPIEANHMCMYQSGDALFYEATPQTDLERAALEGMPRMIPASQVLHLRWASLNGLVGLSRLSLARNAIGLSLAMEDSSARLFARGAQIAGTLSTDKKLSEQSFDRLKAQWRKYEGDGESSGGTPLLEEGLKFEKIAMTMVEAQTVEARRAQFEQIATAFDVPLFRLGIIPEAAAGDIIAAHQQYLNNTLSSDAERWESKLNDLFGLDGESEFVEFDLDYFNRATLKDRLEAARIGIVGSVMTVNEARRHLRVGLPDVEHGDDVFQPANVVPLGTEPKPAPAPMPPGPGSDVTGEPAPGGDGDPAAVPQEDNPANA